jgi:hypothetical protein
MQHRCRLQPRPQSSSPWRLRRRRRQQRQLRRFRQRRPRRQRRQQQRLLPNANTPVIVDERYGCNLEDSVIWMTVGNVWQQVHHWHVTSGHQLIADIASKSM